MYFANQSGPPTNRPFMVTIREKLDARTASRQADREVLLAVLAPSEVASRAARKAG
jgi:hypothetical protein